ncbi:MAG: alpha/beta hydrolase [Limnothrix sp.]
MVSSSSSSPKKSATPQKSKTLLLRLFLWIKRFLDERKLPYVANQACRVYFGKEKSSRRKCQSILQTRIELDHKQLQHFLHTSIGDRLLAWLSPLFHFPDQPNAKHGLRQLILEMAGKPEGISLLHLLDFVPERTEIDLDQLMSKATKVEDLAQKTDLLISEIQAIATAQIEPEQVKQFAKLPDLRERGAFTVKTFRLDCAPETICYQPEPLLDETFVIAQSHGLGATPKDFADYAEHLASYGYFVVAPYHHGSDRQRLQLLLQGKVDEVVPLSEFGDRPAVVTQILDHLESINHSQFQNKLNLKNIGVVGHSFGAYTALVLAGAKIQFEHLELACDLNNSDPNLSLLLQCQALGLPRGFEQLQDKRVTCIFVWDFVGSAIFGQEGLQTVTIPVMAIAGSHDITTPFALEQVRLFRWLQNAHNYLVVMEGKPHVQNLRKLAQAIGLKFAVSKSPKPIKKSLSFAQNIQALSIAFFDSHLRNDPAAPQYLTANYGEYLGRSPQNIYIISGKTAQIELPKKVEV